MSGPPQDSDPPGDSDESLRPNDSNPSSESSPIGESNDYDLDSAFALYLRACDSGEIGSREDFLKRFPSLSGQLRELMEAADMIGNYTLSRSAAPPSIEVETVSMDELGPLDTTGAFSGMDPHATLPMAHRPQGETGPTLPFEMEDYTLLKVLGIGGMGVVYLAKQRDLERLVAVKMIRSGILAGSDEVKRFYTEAKAAARLRHPNIVAVHQFGRRAGHHFFSMQYIEGEDLQRVLKRSPLSPRRAAEVVRDVARAIDHAHSRGVLHRDLKPGNVLIDPSGQIHVTDFGLAKHVDADSSVTGSGEAVGTPHYMAPEQAVGDSEKATAQSDIYSLGAILFAAITGRPPLVGDTVMQTLMRVVHHPAPSLRSVCPTVDTNLDAIAEKCLEKKPQHRYASAAQLADDLDRYLCGQSVSVRSRSRVGRILQWTRQIPVVAALTGQPSTEAPLSQRRVQTGLLLLAVLLPLGFLGGVWLHRRNVAAMPARIVIAGGLPGGLYTDASKHLAQRITDRTQIACDVLPTGGTFDNRDRLLSGQVQLAPMQASAVGGERIAVVAPLYYEAVHLLARHDGPVRSIADLPGQRIAVGPEGSGSRRAAELVLDSLNLSQRDCPRVSLSWPSLKRVGDEEGEITNEVERAQDDEFPAVAIICIGPGSELVKNLLRDQEWDLLPLSGSVSISLQHPTLRPMTLMPDAYPDRELPPAGIETVGTTAFLVCRQDAPDLLVETTLDCLYSEPTLIGLIPATRAAEWQGLAFHRAARRFFDAWAAQ